VAAGFFETASYPFSDRESEEGAWSEWLSATGTAPEPLSIENPLDATRRHLRATLLPGVLDAVSRNLRRGAEGVSLFEVGRAFGAAGDADRPESFESRRLAFATAGERRGHWSTPEPQRAADFYDAKGLVERLVEPWIASSDLSWRPLRVGALAPGASAAVEGPGGVLLGVVGLVAEEERRRRDLGAPVFAGELLLGALPPEPRPYEFREAPLHPAVVADLTVAHGRDLEWARIREFVEGRRVPDLESFRCHDRWQDPRDPDRVKTTLRMVFRSPERTLEQSEVNEAVGRLAREMEAELGVGL
jgi:phenylalanyl-tRNA synthetase beta chain